ncbi:MAG TPA: MEDS domain-containing protein [Verrucomicrobiae bacterium]|nr:MEDS domain-containing protein [Verrucomicrobiae bacterium]
MTTAVDLRPDKAEIFWGEIAPREHLVQIYGDEAPFLDALEGFVVGGLRAGEAVIVIATAKHLTALEQRVQAEGFNLDAARSQNQYISLDAEETLSKFLLGGWPDDIRFRKVVSDLLVKARGNGRRVRAFGEMVAVLWSQGHNGATVRLEHLWHQFCQKEEFSLFCAYPRSGFTQDADASIQEICSAHSKVINLSR